MHIILFIIKNAIFFAAILLCIYSVRALVSDESRQRQSPLNARDTSTPTCDPGLGDRGLPKQNITDGIQAFCKDGSPIRGFGTGWSNMYDYPPANEQQFFFDDRSKPPYAMHLTFGAEAINQVGTGCEGKDTKIVAADCSFAFNALYDKCTAPEVRTNGGEYAYKCVNYKSWAVNTLIE